MTMHVNIANKYELQNWWVCSERRPTSHVTQIWGQGDRSCNVYS